jgi:hypothetical protein
MVGALPLNGREEAFHLTLAALLVFLEHGVVLSFIYKLFLQPRNIMLVAIGQLFAVFFPFSVGTMKLKIQT